MNRVVGQPGFTIVETMIFLSVSGALFASAIVLIGGQQQKSQFNASVRDLDSKIQSVMGNVATGYYNNTGNTKCDNSGPGGSPKLLADSGTTGTNGDCTFLGQVMVPIAEPDKSGFTIYSVAGLRLTGSKDVSSFRYASPTLFEYTKQEYLLNGAEFGWVRYSDSSATDANTDSVGFMTSFVQYNGSALSSGTTNLNIMAIKNTNRSAIEAQLMAQGDDGGGLIKKNPTSIKICIQDGARYGIIDITGGSTQSTIGNGDCPS